LTGFGLPHVDESFTNKDTGSCLDYSDKPQNDLHPNFYNWNFLNDLYGNANYSAPIYPPNAMTSGNGGGRRDLSEDRELLQLPQWAHDEWRQIRAAAIVVGETPSHWRKLHSSPHGDIHEVPLNEGYTIRVERLRPNWLD
jgi:hypothetical protein